MYPPDDPALLAAVANATAEALAEAEIRLPEDVERVILRAVQRDPAKRYPTAGEMGYDLEYAMYHKGYGPTIVTLEKYLRRLFPHLYPAAEREGGESTRRDTKGPFPIPKPR